MSDDKLKVVGNEEESQPSKPVAGDPVPMPGVGTIEPGSLKEKVVEALKTVYDPEIPVNIYELGLIYELDVAESNDVKITMTLTAPGCPVAGQIVEEVNSKVAAVEDVNAVDVQLTWDPPWCMDYMSDAARLALNMM